MESAARRVALFRRRAAQFTESVIREMTRLALKHGAVNLSQGFPDFPAPEEIKQAAHLTRSTQTSINTQSPGARGRCARRFPLRKFQLTQGDPGSADPETDVTVTCGSTEAA